MFNLRLEYDAFIQKLDQVKPRFNEALQLPFDGKKLKTGLQLILSLSGPALDEVREYFLLSRAAKVCPPT